jgi:hypothetical protein
LPAVALHEGWTKQWPRKARRLAHATHEK